MKSIPHSVFTGAVAALVLCLGGCVTEQKREAQLQAMSPGQRADVYACRMQGQMATASAYNPRSIGLEAAATGNMVFETCMQMKSAERAERAAQTYPVSRPAPASTQEYPFKCQPGEDYTDCKQRIWDAEYAPRLGK